MKITVTPGFIHGASFDDVTAAAIMKMHKPRAVKLANIKNVFALLARHNGTARMNSNQSFSTDRWFDCNPAAFSQSTPCGDPTDTVYLESSVGILMVDNTVNAGSEYPNAYQNIFLYIPLNPAGQITAGYNGRGIFPTHNEPCIVFYVEIA